MEPPSLGQDLRDFFLCLGRWLRRRTLIWFHLFEKFKSQLAASLYRQRGRFVRPFVHSGMALLIIGGITLGPTLIAENFPGLTENPWQETLPPSAVLSAATEREMETATLISAKPRSEIVEYEVKEGDTVSGIAEKFGISIDTIRWANNLESIKSIKKGQILKILPDTGVWVEVKYGETIYTLAKKHEVDPQGIVDWPYNSFANDETFALATGQSLFIPDGVVPKVELWAPRPQYAVIPEAGTLAGTGIFVWPASGRLSQGFRWYHQGIDIANKIAPATLAADRGTIIFTGWRSGYGNTVIVDHGNGFTTLYAHLSQISVSLGQRVTQGQIIGQMGATGRATGVHLHFEIRKNGVAQDPINYLK